MRLGGGAMMVFMCASQCEQSPGEVSRWKSSELKSSVDFERVIRLMMHPLDCQSEGRAPSEVECVCHG